MFKIGDIVKLKPSHVLHVIYPNDEFVIEGIEELTKTCLIRRCNSTYNIYASLKHLELVTERLFLYCKPCDLYVPEGAFINCPECGGKMVERKDESRR